TKLHKSSLRSNYARLLVALVVAKSQQVTFAIVRHSPIARKQNDLTPRLARAEKAKASGPRRSGRSGYLSLRGELGVAARALATRSTLRREDLSTEHAGLGQH